MSTTNTADTRTQFRTLFAGLNLPRLKNLKNLGVTGGLMGTAKNLVSYKISHWSESVGPTFISREELGMFFKNRKTVESLMINECECVADGPWVPISTPLPDLKFLKTYCPIHGNLENFFNCIHTLQFKPQEPRYRRIFPPLFQNSSDGH